LLLLLLLLLPESYSGASKTGIQFD